MPYRKEEFFKDPYQVARQSRFLAPRLIPCLLLHIASRRLCIFEASCSPSLGFSVSMCLMRQVDQVFWECSLRCDVLGDA